MQWALDLICFLDFSSCFTASSQLPRHLTGRTSQPVGDDVAAISRQCITAPVPVFAVETLGFDGAKARTKETSSCGQQQQQSRVTQTNPQMNSGSDLTEILGVHRESSESRERGKNDQRDWLTDFPERSTETKPSAALGSSFASSYLSFGLNSEPLAVTPVAPVALVAPVPPAEPVPEVASLTFEEIACSCAGVIQKMMLLGSVPDKI